MNEDVKIAWIDDLLHGGHKQGKGELRSSDGRWCCLGRLCSLAARAGVGRWVRASDGGWKFRDNEAFNDRLIPDSQSAGLTPGVRKWAGLTDDGTASDRLFVRVEPTSEGSSGTLTDLNDTGHPFAEIADVIKDKL